MPDDNSTKRTFLGALPLAGLALAAAGGSAAQSSPSAQPSSERALASVPKPRIVALEEHVMFPEFVGYLAETKQNIRADLFDRVVPILSDFGERRLSVMDRNGVDFVVLSLAGPGVQIERDTLRALALAQRCNDALAAQVHKRPDRYGGCE